MDKKTTSWVAYIGVIGLIIAFCAGDKEGAKFHLNQALVITIASLLGSVVMVIPILGWIVGGLWSVFVINQEEKEVPLLGQFKILK